MVSPPAVVIVKHLPLGRKVVGAPLRSISLYAAFVQAESRAMPCSCFIELPAKFRESGLEGKVLYRVDSWSRLLVDRLLQLIELKEVLLVIKLLEILPTLLLGGRFKTLL
jgi:hypothetical protein